jgi:transcriptional regulator with XRE-family HTH domain
VAKRSSVKRNVGVFGGLVRKHRQRLKLSLSELARRIEMDQGLLSKIERGKRPPPQLVPHVQRIGAALGFGTESPELKELVEAAYKERFGKEKWPEILIVSAAQGPTGPVELVRQPVSRSGLGGYTPSATREIIPPDSPAGRSFGLRPDGTIPPDAIFGCDPFWDSQTFLLHLHIVGVDSDGDVLIFRCEHLDNGKRYEVRVTPMPEASKEK